MVLLSRFLSIGSKMTTWSNKIHSKCRREIYPRSDQKRLAVPNDKVKWSASWPDYNPPKYTSISLKGQPWADLEISDQFSPKFNQVEREEYVVRNRVSSMGDYQILNGFPLNPVGRTGLKGRGLLGLWGPNHAADFILTRFLRDQVNGQKILNEDTKNPFFSLSGFSVVMEMNGLFQAVWLMLEKILLMLLRENF
jgi:ADP-ribose pyrophosphatase